MKKNNKNHKNLKEFPIMGDWVPRIVVKKFFNYGNTKMASFARDHDIRVSRIGKRIFYKYSDLLRLIEDNTEIENLY
ncbi:hypothetical protein [Winogradskyella aquimaris]|uniref:DNA-binding protein n=1 Tax=Winogradskyella aquimaris TaxID=864074 RepID=A0ABU5ERM2_9FLAO|nr:hypothetical protein [Winogradskyella aquimaris]MDY2588213.1 hypothetical protein [Winogradskyella aquimaris]